MWNWRGEYVHPGGGLCGKPGVERCLRIAFAQQATGHIGFRKVRVQYQLMGRSYATKQKALCAPI